MELLLSQKENDFIVEFPDQPISLESNLSYWFSDQNSEYRNKKITTTFKSTGKFGQSLQESITTTIELDIENIIEKKSNDGGGDGTRGIEMIVSKPSGLNVCTFTNEIKKDCSYNTDIDLTKDNSKKNSIPSKFYIGGNATFGDISGGVEKESEIYIVGNATFDDISGGIGMNSVIYIGGNATFDKISGGIKKAASVYIQGNANFNTIRSELHKEGKVCVGGYFWK